MNPQLMFLKLNMLYYIFDFTKKCLSRVLRNPLAFLIQGFLFFTNKSTKCKKKYIGD